MIMYASFSMSRPQNGIEWSEGRANKAENLLSFCNGTIFICLLEGVGQCMTVVGGYYVDFYSNAKANLN